jgi:hypothetical protein
MLQSPAEFAKERFWHYVETLAVVATFWLAGVITDIAHDITWFKINLFFFVSGAIAFVALFVLDAVLNEAKDIKRFAGMCIAIAFLPAVVFLVLAVLLFGVPVLVLLIVVRLLTGKKLFDKSLDKIAGLFLKVFDRGKVNEKTVEARHLLEKVPCGTRVLSADLCSGKPHEECVGFERAMLGKHTVTPYQVGEPIFCVCTCHKHLRRRLKPC